jgi:hypothetical protein
MADPKNALNTGILATPNPQVQQYLNTLDSLRLRQTDMVDVRRREAELSKYLGAPDYDAQIDKSREDAKLQFFLQMAQRGFAAAGAAPRRGESTVSTLSRELFSPLAGDASKLAGQFTKEKRAIDTAKRAGTRQLRLAALQQSQAGQARLEALATKLMPSTTNKLQVSTGANFRQNLADGTLGPVVPAKTVAKNNELSLVRVDNDENIRVGTGTGEYTLFNPSASGKTAKGTKGVDFQATFSGYLGGLGGLQDALGFGSTGMRFIPANYNPEKGLDPNQKSYPFGRVDNKELTLGEKKKFTNLLESGYFNAFKALKQGDSLLDLNKAFSRSFFNQNLEQLGLSPGTTVGQVDPRTVKTPSGVTAMYKEAIPAFEELGDLSKVLSNMPDPVGRMTHGSAIGKLRLAWHAGFPLGETTNSPAPYKTGEDVTERATLVKGMDRGSIELRALTESLAKGTSLAGKLLPDEPSLDSKIGVVSKAISDKADALKKRQNSAASIQAARLFSGSLDALERIDRMTVDAALSGVQGVITGPVIGKGVQLIGTDFLSWFKNTQEKKSTKNFVAGLPVLQELYGRELVKVSEGEGARITGPDIKGVQKTLFVLGESKDYSAAKIKELRRYLVSAIKVTANQLGNFVVDDATLEKAAELGIDLKGITGKGGSYNPYLNNGTYAVTKAQIPEFSKEYMESLRIKGLFDYVSDREKDPRFKLIDVDDKGQPVLAAKQKQGFSYISLSTEDLTDPAFKAVVDFNKNWLRKSYSLGK